MRALILATVTVLVWGTSVVQGADKDGPEFSRTAPGEGSSAAGREKSREHAKPRTRMAELARICGLSDEQLKKLMDLSAAHEKALQELNDKSDAQFIAVLTPEQRSKWNETMLMALVQREFGNAGLTDEQTARIRTEIATRSKDIFFAANEETSQTIRNLMLFIKDNVLTEAQKTAIRQARPKSREAGKPGDAGAGKPEKKPEGQ